MAYVLVFFLPFLIGLSNADDFFQIAPTDVNIYYDTPKKFERYCIPPGQSDFVITWWRDDKRLGSQDKPNANINIPSRIKIRETSDLQSTKWHSVTPGSKISLLQINSVLPTDQGEYSCVATNKSGHFSAKFDVKVTDACRGGSFKCAIDKKCILNYTLCDGIAQCSNDLDESTMAGCSLPSPPKHLIVKASEPNEIMLTWQPVSKATHYEIEITYPDGSKKIISKSSRFNIAVIDGLKSKTEYGAKIRTRSLTGVSNFTDQITVSTNSLETPAAPLVDNANIIRTVTDISLSWKPVPNAVTYEITFRSPDGSVKKIFRSSSERTIHFSGLQEDTLYVIRIRARSSSGIAGRFAKMKVKTLKNAPPSAPENIRHIVNARQSRVEFSWNFPTDMGTSFKPDLNYQFEYCIFQSYKVIFKEYRNVSVVVPDDQNNTPDMKTKSGRQNDNNIPDGKNNVGRKKTRKIVLKLVDVVKTRYRPIDCKQMTVSQKLLSLKLKPGFYFYNLTTLGINNIEGGTRTGNFTIDMYTPTTEPEAGVGPTAIPMPGAFSGIIIFAIVTAGLCVILLVSFFMAWLCKWKLLTDAVDAYKLDVIENNRINNLEAHQRHNNNDMYKKLNS
eukprot:TCONS_00002265-protein